MKNKTSFELQIMKSSLVPNLLYYITEGLILFYFSGVIKTREVPFASLLLIITAGFIIGDIILLPRIIYVLSMSINKRIEKERKTTCTAKERTDIVKKIMIFPLPVSFAISIFHLLMSYGILAFLKLYYLIDIPTFIFLVCGFFYIATVNAVKNYSAAEVICSKIAQDMLKHQVDHEIIRKKQFYGLSLYLRIAFHIILPFILATITQLAFVNKIHYNIHSIFNIHMDSLLLLTLNVATYIILSDSFFKHIYATIFSQTKLLENITSGQTQDDNYIPTDLSYEFEYNLFLTNDLLKYIDSISAFFAFSSKNILNSTNDLSLISNTNTRISMTEKSNVTECLAIMNERKSAFAAVKKRMANIIQAAEETQQFVKESGVILKSEIEKMSDITEINLKTMSKIKELNDKIDDVKKLIANINSIAEKNKMIAFNAELKASSSNQMGRNFHIIANELRRLVSTITSSTGDIQSSIKDIQEAADNLIISSEGETQKIREGSEFFCDLEKSFNELEISSTVTTESVHSMKDGLDEQYESFLQIFESLNQMSKSLTELDKTTKAINTTSESLFGSAIKLNKINYQTGAYYNDTAN